MNSDTDRIRREVSLSDTAVRFGVDLAKDGSEWLGLCPFHQDDTPSFTIFTGRDHVQRMHCLAGETRVITWRGTFAIRDLAGARHRILTSGGVWVDAEFKSYGRQKLYEINLSRNRVKKTIRATDGHRWLVRTGVDRQVERTTDCLRPGHRLIAVVPKSADQGGHLSRSAIQHGFCFGDGAPNRNHTHAYLTGNDKLFMHPYFEGDGFPRYERSDGRTVYRNLPKAFKALPTREQGENGQYFFGFLAGLIAADGHVSKDGTVILNQVNTAALQWVRDYGSLHGLVTYPITTQIRVGITGTPLPISRIHFAVSALPSGVILNPKMQRRLGTSKKRFERLRWQVVAVKKTDIEEEVFCAEVPETHAFALEDNILTGNCFGCGAKGDVLDFVQQIKRVDLPGAIRILNGAVAGPNIAPRRVEVRDAYADITASDPVEALEPGKRVTLYNPKRAGTEREVGSFVPSMIFPYRREDGSLFGYVLRHDLPGDKKETPMVMWVRLPNGRETWCRYPFPKPRPLYGLEALGDGQVIVVEGEKCRDALARATGRVVVSWSGGTEGVKHTDWTPLKGRPAIVWPDADGPGMGTASNVARVLADQGCAVRIMGGSK